MATPGKIAKFDTTGKVTNSIITETDGGSIVLPQVVAEPFPKTGDVRESADHRKWYESSRTLRESFRRTKCADNIH